MKAQYLSIAIGASLFAITSLAQANTTYSSFVDVTDSVSFDGWNQLTRNRVDDNGAANPLTAAQLAAGTLVNFVNTGTVDDYYYYSWDLSGISTPITSYTLNFSAGFSQALAFQVDQVAAVSSVPEADSYAMMMLGLGVMGAVARRRSK